MELLQVFNTFHYPNEIGPGVYDIHSPNSPTQEQVVPLMRKAAEKIPAHRLWVNPYRGFKDEAVERSYSVDHSHGGRGRFYAAEAEEWIAATKAG